MNQKQKQKKHNIAQTPTLELQIWPGMESTNVWNSSLSACTPQCVRPELIASWKDGRSDAMLSGV